MTDTRPAPYVAQAHKFWQRSVDISRGNAEANEGGDDWNEGGMSETWSLYCPDAPSKNINTGQAESKRDYAGGFSRKQVATALNRHPQWNYLYHTGVYDSLCLGRNQRHVALSLGISYPTLRNYCSQIRGEIRQENN